MPHLTSTSDQTTPADLEEHPISISRRITDLSSDKDAFLHAAPLYNDTLRASGYDEEIQFWNLE